jgi:hypothetical protein
MRAARIPRLARSAVAARAAAAPAPKTFATAGPGAGHDFSRLHVIAPQLQRWSYGSGAPPDADYSVVPKADRGRIDDAMGLLERVATKPKDYPVCHKFFQTECPGGTAATFANLVSGSRVWHDRDNTVWASSKDPSDIAYSDETWRWGRWSLAGAFVHEMMHNGGQDTEATNDKAIVKCGFPDIQTFKHKKK